MNMERQGLDLVERGVAGAQAFFRMSRRACNFWHRSCRKTLHHALKASACQYFACCFSAAMKSPLRPSRAARISSLAGSTSSTSARGGGSDSGASLAASLRRSRSSMARAVEGLEAS